VGLALMLTIGASMLLKSLVGLHQREPGFRADQVLTMKLSLSERKYGDVEALARLQEAIETRVRALPGVRAAAMAGSLPLELGPEFPFTIEGRAPAGAGGASGAGTASGGAEGAAQTRLVGAGYFETLRIPLRRGRWFDDRDRRGALPVVVINEVIARRYWPNGNALGQRLTVGPPMRSELAESEPRLIIGIVGNVREEGLNLDPSPIVYLPMAQGHAPFVRQLVRILPLALALRADGDAAALAPAVQRAIWSLDPDQPVTNLLLMDEIVARSLGPNRFNTLVLSLLAGLALLLAAVGLYGVLSHLVSQRTREVGVRMALGASRGAVLSLFLRQGLSLTLLGLAAGLGGAALLTRLLRSLVVDVSAYDPWLFMLSPLVLLTVAILAIAGPALRAARIDPSRALHGGE
jgi:putative ABC transport system permease protein